MTTTPIAYRVVSPERDEWYEDAGAADVGAARQLDVTLDQIPGLRRRITVDPVVVRRDGARWRSRQVWSLRLESSTVRIFEMLRIDEALYDH